MAKEKFSEQYTRYEVARILGARALQLSMNAPLLLKIDKEELEVMRYDPLKIADKEFRAGVLPITVKRPLPQRMDVEEAEEAEEAEESETKEIKEEKKKEEKIEKETVREEMGVETDEELEEKGETDEVKKEVEDKEERGEIEVVEEEEESTKKIDEVGENYVDEEID